MTIAEQREVFLSWRKEEGPAYLRRVRKLDLPRPVLMGDQERFKKPKSLVRRLSGRRVYSQSVAIVGGVELPADLECGWWGKIDAALDVWLVAHGLVSRSAWRKHSLQK